MVGAAQVGVVAACVVLFVPMGMAGWHLSRNKMLFFSGALFITLAVGVHLTPYFPSLSHLLLSSLLRPRSSLTALLPASSCLPFLHDILWPPSRSPASAWAWARSGPAAACAFHRLARPDASDLLNGSRLTVAGDSQARLFVLALLDLLLDPDAVDAVRAALFRRHSDYHIALPGNGLTVDFLWAPYETNLTLALHELAHGPRLPEVLVVGGGLWHMLHFTDAADYGAGLASIRRSAEALFAPASARLPHMFWLGMPTLVNSKLNTEEKRARMNESVCEAYEKEVRDSKILRRSRGPFLLLDVGSLSRGCGSQCAEDGMHYDGAVYEAALHVMLNALLIESQQSI